MEILKKTGIANLTRYARKPKYIVIHYTAGVNSKAGTAANVAAYFAKEAAKASADYIVDDRDIVQYNPDPTQYYCWAVGGNKQTYNGGGLYGIARNNNCVSIEMCSSNSTGKVTKANDSNWSISSKVVANTIELTKYLMKTYGISADRVIRHYDVNGKYCPGVVGWNDASGDDSKWNAFKAKLTGTSTVTTSSAKQTQTATTTSSTSYKVKITASVLNVRKGPGTSYAVATTVKKGEVYTIVGEQNGWGKLKSGAGWISLQYVTKTN